MHTDYIPGELDVTGTTGSFGLITCVISHRSFRQPSFVGRALKFIQTSLCQNLNDVFFMNVLLRTPQTNNTKAVELVG